MDVLSDVFADRRRFRIWALVDDFTRQNLAQAANLSPSGLRGDPDRGPPETARPDRLRGHWSRIDRHGGAALKPGDRGKSHDIAPGRPTRNACVGCVDGRLSDLHLNAALLAALCDARDGSGRKALGATVPDTDDIQRWTN